MEIKFEGIDYWNRPVFRQVDGDNRFGSVDLLCSNTDEVKERISADDLVYFGTTFDEDDPQGTPLKKGALTIIW
jgi:hypothetical protein